MTITLEALLASCADDSFDAGIRINTELVPLGGPGAPVKPAVYKGGNYQQDRRWESPDAEEPTPIIVIDNVPSQANRLEDALRRRCESLLIPEFVLDLSDITLPAHLPTQISSFQFPHRNGDAYLRDSTLEGEDFLKTEIGQSIFNATAATCGPLMAWFPQALLFGFWQSHLGKKRQNTKHARAWVSEIVGWRPATTETRILGLKGDPLNLSIDEDVTFDPDNRTVWGMGNSSRIEGSKKDQLSKKKLSEIGHGQIPFMDPEAVAAGAVSFARISQCASISFAQLRRVSLGSTGNAKADAAARALLVALGLHAHLLAFGRGFALRSGAELQPKAEAQATWLGNDNDRQYDLAGLETSESLVVSAKSHAEECGVPLDGWRESPLILRPKENLANAIRATWPEMED